MALSEDQRAMLRLLAQREQGYEDIAALMGLSVDEVRARVGEALAELERDDPEAVAPPPEPEPETAPEPATPAPEPEPPPAPPPQPEPPAVAPAPVSASRPSPRPPQRPQLKLPAENGPRAAIAAGLAALVAIVVVLLVGGGDNGAKTATGAAGEATTTATGNGSGNPSAAETKAVLSPVGDSGASGEATFGRIEESLGLQVEAEGLQPTGKGEEYTIWLAQSPQRMLPLASTTVDQSGEINAQFELPVEILAYLANETFDQIAVTLTENSKLKASLTKATKETKAPSYTGDEVMRGVVTGPIVGAQLREEEAE